MCILLHCDGIAHLPFIGKYMHNILHEHTMRELSNMQYVSAWLSFTLLPAGTFHQLAGECHSS